MTFTESPVQRVQRHRKLRIEVLGVGVKQWNEEDRSSRLNMY